MMNIAHFAMPKMSEIPHNDNMACKKCRKFRYFCGRILARILRSRKVYEVFHVWVGLTGPSHWGLKSLWGSMNMNGSVQEQRFVLRISRPPLIAQKWFYTQNLPMGLSFQENKTIWKSDSWLPRYSEKFPVYFILGHPVTFEIFPILRVRHGP